MSKGEIMSSGLRGHLVSVYGLLLLACLSAAGGCWLYIDRYVVSTIGFVFSFVFIILLACLPRGMYKSRFVAYNGVAVCCGVVAGELVEISLKLDPMLLVAAVGVTAMVFVWFSLGALFLDKASSVALGGILGTTLSYMCIIGVVNMFIPSAMLFSVQLYGGLLMFCLYVVFDTYDMIRRYNEGERDTLDHAMNLFLDLFGIFIRILIILVENKSKSETKSKSKYKKEEL